MSSVEQDTIDCEYLAYFEPKNIKNLPNFLKEIHSMQLFSVDATLFQKRMIFFAHEIIKKIPSKVAYFSTYTILLASLM